MRRTLLWLLASLAFASFTSVTDGAQLEVMSAPNLMRIGTPENIFVELQDYTGGGDVQVVIRVKSHPIPTREFASATVTLNSSNHFQAMGSVTVPPKDFNRDPSVRQYVYLQAQFPGMVVEKVVMVSFQAGYIFIQTDKTLYTPESTVLYRVFGLTPSMKPVEDFGGTAISVTIEIETPDGLILPHETITLDSGLKSGHYKLAELVSVGVWKILAKFSNNPQQTFSAAFEVKEYVLPSFEVKITPRRPFFYVDDEEFTVNIKATYLFGQPVAGMAYVVFGVMSQIDKETDSPNDQKTSLPSSLQKVALTNGQAEVTMTRAHLTHIFPNTVELAQQRRAIFVDVSVLTESGSEMVGSELKNIPIVTSPYTISFKNTPPYYKSGITFDVTVKVVNPDKTPAKNVDVMVDVPSESDIQTKLGTTDTNGLARVTLNIIQTTADLTIRARTNVETLPEHRQASANMVARVHRLQSDKYIHIGIDSARVAVGDDMKVTVIRNRDLQSDITFLISSRGQLVGHHHSSERGQVISERIPITNTMLPSFRIVAYYHTSNSEVVSDSVWVDVDDTCMGSLKLEPLNKLPAYQPGTRFGLKVTGDPGATVGLVAVDKGVYVLNNKYRLTQKVVWDIVEQFDTGCTPGGGKDAMHVFYDAGLAFQSSNPTLGTPYRQQLKCSSPQRRKRAITIMDVVTTAASNYTDPLLRECCTDGMKPTPLSYTCEVRSEYVVDGEACAEAFLRCCKTMENEREERREDNLILARSEEEDGSYDDDITSRSKFPESWLWKEITIPSGCPQENPNCKNSLPLNNVYLQDSITTWQFTGISLSRTHGICISEPLEVIVRKEFFIDLRLPYAAVRGEQIEVRAILHNLGADPITVRVDLLAESNICSFATKRGKYRQELSVGGQTTRAVPFIIIPMKHGEFPIEVQAAVKDSWLSDGIQKMLRVVPAGIPVKKVITVVLDPATKGVGGKQTEILNSEIKSGMAPGTTTATEISVTGREMIGGMVESALSGKSMKDLIFKPHGCGEQNIMRMTLPVIAATYLDKTNQWEAVGFDKRNEAIGHMRTGLQTELKYRKSDGSFAMYPESTPNTWLTAYVTKVFAMASNYISIPSEVLCGAIRFLILSAQQPNGRFIEVGYAMSGTVTGYPDADVAMTAFCLIAIQESSSRCAVSVQGMPDSRRKAASYIEDRLHSLTSSYAVAMASYALANENKFDREVLYKFVSRELSHWPATNNMEATAYALLALVKAGLFEDARPVVRWFNQQSWYKGYGASQTTIMVYQAVAEYWTHDREPDYNLNVNITLPERSEPMKINFNKNNQFNTRTSKVNSINQNITVSADGTGEATFKMVSLYYGLPKEKENNCDRFNLSVQVFQEKLDEVESVYKLTIKVFYKSKERDATMSILDIGLLTGFTYDTTDLDKLSTGHGRVISKYELNNYLSERGSLILYLDKVSHTRPEEITFRIRQTFKVGVPQPAAVSIYEYYDETPCMRFYHLQRKDGELLQLCVGIVCTCAEENCSMQKADKVDNFERTDYLCVTTAITKIDFAYKVKVEEFIAKETIDVYDMKILSVIKEGTTDVGPLGKKRAFLGYPHCRKALGLQSGKTYLLMGTSKDIQQEVLNNVLTYRYMLGQNTWVEYWPTDSECQTDDHELTCSGIQEMKQQYELFGCLNK
ncbi:complement C3-like [Nelusetta ayraudi]|uniref:complement C3-like n=1 Tax=Nelusetta ayraudi TaxID=303726 RepID=UPI003F6F290A